MLLDEMRGDSALAEIAARHKRSTSAICAQVKRLLKPEQEFSSWEALFEWARSELREGLGSAFGWAQERADAAAAGEYPVLSEPNEYSTEGEQQGWTPVRVQPATAERRDEVITLWSSITASADSEQATQERPCAELDVLATVGDARLKETGLAVMQSHGELSLASWVLECDWPGVERLDITADQIRRGDAGIQETGADLLLAGLRKSMGRDYEIMRMRLGLTGEAMTLDAIGKRFDRSRERIRQLQDRALTRARVSKCAGVRRSWHYVHDALLAVLGTEGVAPLDPDLVLSFVELAVPAAPRDVAVAVVARLCGLKKEDSDGLIEAVDERKKERTWQHQERLREEKKLGRLAAKVQRLLDKAEWPQQTLPAGGDANPVREPNDSARYGKPGRWRSDRLGRDVGYDSETELHIIQMLDLSDDLVASYCEQPVTISYMLYENRHDYYPDLLVDLCDERRLLVEVKARIDEFALYENVCKFKAAKEFCRALGWGFVATTDHIQTPSDLLKRQVDARIEHVLRSHLSAGPTDWKQLYPLACEHGIRYTDIATLVLRNGWYWHKKPFRLSTTPLDGKLRWQPVPRRPPLAL